MNDSTKYKFKEMAVGESWLCEATLRDGAKKKRALDAAKQFYKAKGVHFTIKEVAKGFICTVTRNDLLDETVAKNPDPERKKKEKKPRSPDADVRYFFRAALLNSCIMNSPSAALENASEITRLYKQEVYDKQPGDEDGENR